MRKPERAVSAPPTTVAPTSLREAPAAYAPRPIVPPQRDISAERVRYRGFWIRVAAHLIDVIVVSVLTAIVLVTLGTIAGAIASLFLPWLYFALMEGSWARGTLGKLSCGIAVTNVRGKPISFWRGTGRYFAKIISALPLGLGFLMIGWTRNKRGLHDLIAGTVVIDRD